MASSTKIGERIATEQKARDDARSLKAQLTKSRSDALAEGADDVVIDRIEADIMKAERSFERSAGRIQLLEGELAKAHDAENTARLDDVAAKADRARKLGEQLIHGRYRKAASEIVDVLEHLKAIDEVIIEANIELRRAGRKHVLSPNVTRGREGRVERRTVKRSVYPTDPMHPDAAYIKQNTVGVCIDTRTNAEVRGTRTVEFEEERVVPGNCPDELYNSVVLPTTDVDGMAIWPTSKSDERTAALIKTLTTDGDSVIGKLKSLAGGGKAA